MRIHPSGGELSLIVLAVLVQRVCFIQQVKSKKDTIIWLWETHNRVNKRLSGDKHEDPQHPKIQFPSSNSCKLCHGPRGRLNRDKVLEFLVDHYSHFRLGDIYQPGRLLDINQEGTGEDKYWLLLSLSSIDLSLCFLLWAGSIAMVIFFCVYFKCWKNPASKKVVRYFLGNNKHFRYAR